MSLRTGSKLRVICFPGEGAFAVGFRCDDALGAAFIEDVKNPLGAGFPMGDVNNRGQIAGRGGWVPGHVADFRGRVRLLPMPALRRAIAP